MIAKLLVIPGAELIVHVSVAAIKILRRRPDVPGGQHFSTPLDRSEALNRQFEELCQLVERGRLAQPPASMTKGAVPSKRVARPAATAANVPANDLASKGPRIRIQDLKASAIRRGKASKISAPLEECAQAAASVAWRTPLARNSRHRASLPHGVRIYAVGDIHGRADLLDRLLSAIDADCVRRPAKQTITVFVGDYIDRGPASRQVIDLLLQWRQHREAVFLKGNHETFLPRFLADSRILDSWRLCGGLETLLSYGLKPTINADRQEQIKLADELASAISKDHLDFLETLKLSYECGDFLFVHAGIRPNVPVHAQAERDLLWIREEFLGYEQPFERFIVHGHTPAPVLELRQNRINIDTGAFATGRLTCIAIEGSTITPLAT